MSWLKMDDCFPGHPKVVKLSHKAFRLHVTALCYCAQNLTDGLIAREALPIIGAIAGKSKTLTDELEVAVLWIPVAEGWTVNGYLDLNPSKHEVGVRRTIAKANAERRWHGANGSADGNANGIAGGSAEPNALPSPSPSRPQKSVSSSPKEVQYVGTVTEIGGSTFDRIVAICEHSDSAAREKLERTRRANQVSESKLVDVLWAIRAPGTRNASRKALSMMKREAA